MRLLCVWIALSLLFTLNSSADVSYGVNRNKTMTHVVTFNLDDTDESDAIPVSGLCSVVFEQSGSDTAALYSVDSKDEAATSGDLIGSFSTSTTAATVFRPGSRWVKAVGTTSDSGGSNMVITCNVGSVFSGDYASSTEGSSSSQSGASGSCLFEGALFPCEF